MSTMLGLMVTCSPSTSISAVWFVSSSVFSLRASCSAHSSPCNMQQLQLDSLLGLRQVSMPHPDSECHTVGLHFSIQRCADLLSLGALLGAVQSTDTGHSTLNVSNAIAMWLWQPVSPTLEYVCFERMKLRWVVNGCAQVGGYIVLKQRQ